jgi:hypothetical protein
MKNVEELRRYVHVRADAVPESEARHILDRATRTWQQHPGRWRRPQTVLKVGLALVTIASIGFVQIWAVQHRVAAPKVVPVVVPQHTFKAAEGIAIGTDGSVYVSDYSGQRVFRLQKNGSLSVVAGTGVFAEGGDGGLATKADLQAPTGMAFDRSGSLYVADQWGDRVRRIDRSGIITTIAGSGPTTINRSPSYPAGGLRATAVPRRLPPSTPRWASRSTAVALCTWRTRATLGCAGSARMGSSRVLTHRRCRGGGGFRDTWHSTPPATCMWPTVRRPLYSL